ncbi:MAG: oligopeptidase B, partial [Dermatophilaceae bacterium]
MQQPPVARRDPAPRTHHGDTFEDPYAWMADRGSAEFLDLLAAENAWTDEQTSHVTDLADTIYAEFRARINETDLSVPVRHDRWWYYSRTIEGEQYRVDARVRIADHPGRPALDGGRPPVGEEVLLDQNAEARGHEFFAVTASEVSPTGDLIAYAVDLAGDERSDVRVRRIETGEVLDDAIRQMGGSLAWSLDGNHLFYTRVDDAWRPHQVWRHEVGTPQEADVLVHDETDERFFVGVGNSRDDRLIVIGIGSKTTNEFRLIDAAAPLDAPRIVAQRRQDVEYDIEPIGDQLLIVHNARRVNFEVAVAPLT